MRIFAAVLLGVVGVLVVVWLGDWVVWRGRGGAMGSVAVTQVVVAPLKGNKEEYYPDGETTVTCSQSLFPWAGAGACWYVQRHRTVEER